MEKKEKTKLYFAILVLIIFSVFFLSYVGWLVEESKGKIFGNMLTVHYEPIDNNTYFEVIGIISNLSIDYEEIAPGAICPTYFDFHHIGNNESEYVIHGSFKKEQKETILELQVAKTGTSEENEKFLRRDLDYLNENFDDLLGEPTKVEYVRFTSSGDIITAQNVCCNVIIILIILCILAIAYLIYEKRSLKKGK